MSIQQELRDELIRAMKAHDTPTVNVIRQVESEIGLVRSAEGFSGDVDDQVYEETIAAYVKKLDRSQKEYLALGSRGAEQVEKLTFEIEYLDRWLPAPAVSEEETAAIVSAVIAELGADDPKMVGRVIGRVMKTNSELDGGVVNRIAREQLGA